MKNYLVGLALGLSLVACAQESSNNEGSSSADQTAAAPGPAFEPGPVQKVSPDGVEAASVLFVHEQIILNATGSASGTPAQDWFDTTTATDAWFEKHDEAKSTFYFTGKAGDTVRQLVIDKDFPFTAFVPSYTARVDEAPIPATAKHLEGVDLAAVLTLAKMGSLAMHTPADPAATELSKFAHEWLVVTNVDVQYLAPGDARFTFGATILAPAETIGGDATFDLRVTGDAYVAKTTINKDKKP